MESFIKRTLPLLLTAPFYLFPLGEKPEVISGQAAFEKPNPTTEVVRVTDKTIIQYQRFNLAQNEKTEFVQPSHKSTLLCRIKGRDPSVLRGRLEANGKLLFINPNGIIFSETAHVNVGTLIASTLDIENTDFLNGRFRFNLSPEAYKSSILNKGHIQAAHDVVFMAPQIRNQGIISAHAGKVALLGGEMMTLDFDEDNLISFAIETPLKQGFIEQAGQILGSKVWMNISTASQLIKSVLNVNDLVEAGRIEIENGVIRLTPKNKTEAGEMRLAGRSLEIAGELKIPGLCELTAEQEMRWLEANQVGDLKLKAHHVHIEKPIQCKSWTSQVSGEYILAAPLHLQNHALSFDAPVIVSAPQLMLSTGDIGGEVIFHDRIEADAKVGKVNLLIAAGSGDISFEKGIGEINPLESLTILSAHNVNLGSAHIGSLIQDKGTGITTLRGVIHSLSPMDLRCYALNISNSIWVKQGSVRVETSGPVKISETAQITADSFSQEGTGETLLGGKIFAQNGDISFASKIDLMGAVELKASMGDVNIHQVVHGNGQLEIEAKNIMFKEKIDRIGRLQVRASESIIISDIRTEESVNLQAKGPIFFKGSHYLASKHLYQSDHGFFFNSAVEPSFGASNTKAPIIFKGGPMHLEGVPSLSLHTMHEPIVLTTVQGKGGAHLQAESTHGSVSVSRIQGIDQLRLNAEAVEILGQVDVGSLHLTSIKPVDLAHSLTALTGDFIVIAPLHFTAQDSMLQAVHGKLMRFGGQLSGNTQLTVLAHEASVVLDGPLKGLERFKQISIQAKDIYQNSEVVSTGPLHYRADRIHIGGDITTDKSAITLDGPVTLTKESAVRFRTGYVKGNITLTSTLDALYPTSTLIIQNGKGLLQFKGEIGATGPLGELILKSGQITFHGNIGGVQPGIMHRLDVQAVGVDCRSLHYFTGEQIWDITNLYLTNDGACQLATQGGPLRFGSNATIQLEKTAEFHVNTHGGLLDLAPIIVEKSQPIKIQTGKGEAHLREITGKVAHLFVEGGDILLAGKIEADQILMEAERHFEYDRTRGGMIYQTSVHSRGTMTLNAKFGMVGSEDKPIQVNSAKELFVGAKSIACLKGRCADGYPHVYPSNPPPRIFFNGAEFQYLFIDDASAGDENMKTLASDLFYLPPVSLMDGSVLQPRRASIYYEHQ